LRFLGLTLADQGNYKDAIPYLQKAFEMNPQSYWAHIHYGVILYELDTTNILECVEKKFCEKKKHILPPYMVVFYKKCANLS